MSKSMFAFAKWMAVNSLHFLFHILNLGPQRRVPVLLSTHSSKDGSLCSGW